MTSTTFDSFLPAAFRAFLYEVCRIERQIRGRLAQDAAARADVRPTPAADLRGELESLLEQQKADALARGRDPESATFQQARHLMAALADAILQGFDWWGQKTWLEQPLAAGFPTPDGVAEELSEQVEDLLTAEDPDPELAQLYLLALASGAFADLDAASFRRRLFEVLGGPFPELTDQPDRLFAAAYQRRQRRGPAALLPPVRIWLTAVLVLGAVLLAVSAPLWLDATAAARQAVAEILSPPGSGD